MELWSEALQPYIVPMNLEGTFLLPSVCGRKVPPWAILPEMMRQKNPQTHAERIAFQNFVMGAKGSYRLGLMLMEWSESDARQCGRRQLSAHVQGDRASRAAEGDNSCEHAFHEGSMEVGREGQPMAFVPDYTKQPLISLDD